MKIIRPVVVTDDVLTACSIPEDDYDPWDDAVTYALGDRCIKAHRIWESAIPGNIDHDPTEAQSTQWFDAGPVNRWGMFDDLIGSRSAAVGSFTVELEPGAVNALAIVDTNAATVRVKMTVGATVVYDRTQSTNAGGSAITNWYLYFFEPLGRRRSLLFMDLPYHPDGKVEVTVTATDPANVVYCGVLAVGRQRDLGMTEVGVEISIMDFNEKTRDRFGFWKFLPIGWAKTMTLRTKVRTSESEALIDLLASYRGMPIVWIGEPGISSTILFGIFTTAKVTLSVRTVSYLSLSLEGGTEL